MLEKPRICDVRTPLMKKKAVTRQTESECSPFLLVGSMLSGLEGPSLEPKCFFVLLFCFSSVALAALPCRAGLFASHPSVHAAMTSLASLRFVPPSDFCHRGCCRARRSLATGLRV